MRARDEKALHLGEEGTGQARERRGAAGSGVRKAPGTGTDGGAGEATPRVRASFTLRRVRIDPARNRLEHIARLEDLMEELNDIISDPSGYGDLQVRAMNTLIGAIRMCYRIVVDVERLEHELGRLKEENENRRTARGELGYKLKG